VINPYIVDWNIDVNSRDVLERLRAKGLLRFDSKKRTWSFGHHQAQAYFAAAAIAANSELLEQVIPEVSDYWWREVLALLAGLLPDPSQFVFDLIDHDELVAANCAEAVQGLLDSNTTEAVIDGLVERMRSEGTLRRKYIVERLGNSPHPKAMQALLLTMHQQWSSKVLMAIVLAVAGFIAEHPEVDIAEEEAELLARSHRAYEPVADVLNLCMHLIQHQSNRWKKKWVDQLIDIAERQAGPPLPCGLAAIGLGFANDTEARQHLLRLFRADDSDDMISWCALEALSLQADEEEVRKVAVLALNDTSEAARRRRSQAIFLLGHMEHDQKIIAYIIEALADECPSVRAAAVEALADKDLSGGRARKSIEELLQVETDPVVLRKAAESLGRIGTYNTIPLLAQHTANPNTQTRRAVKKAILDIRERQA
jgi:HEAT repeat protein